MKPEVIDGTSSVLNKKRSRQHGRRLGRMASRAGGSWVKIHGSLIISWQDRFGTGFILGDMAGTRAGGRSHW
jgi:hypothetical protein